MQWCLRLEEDRDCAAPWGEEHVRRQKTVWKRMSVREVFCRGGWKEVLNYVRAAGFVHRGGKERRGMWTWGDRVGERQSR